jgi:tetratricopeptide (TPR) repeat protein
MSKRKNNVKEGQASRASDPQPPVKRAVILISLALLIILTLITFLPIFSCDFTNFDDNRMVTQNPLITSLSWRNLRVIFTRYFEALYHPLVLLSYAIEYHFFGLNPVVYHATNLALHIISCALVFWLIILISGRVGAALVTAVLFGIHPLHVESVAWVTERKDMLYAPFFLGALISYELYMVRGGRRYYILALFLFLFSLLSKPMAVTLPVLLILMDYIRGRGVRREGLIKKLPFFALAFVFVIVTIRGHYQPVQEKAIQEYNFTLFQRVFVVSYNILFYLWKMFVPVRLSCYYPYPVKGGNALVPVLYISPFVLAALVFLAFFRRRRTRAMVFGGLFYLATLLPVAQVLPVGAYGIPADRYSYIPLIGVFYILGELFHRIYHHRNFRHAVMRVLMALIMGLLIGVLSFLAQKRCRVWKDSLSLWNNVLEQYPRAAIAFHGRGSYYAEKGETDRAILDYSWFLELRADYPPVLNARGMCYVKKGEWERALADFNEAVRLRPLFADGYYNRGGLYMNRGETEKAIQDFLRVLEIQPDSYDAYNNLGVAYQQKKEWDRSISYFTRALDINPGYANAYANRGISRRLKGELDGALDDLKRAIGMKPSVAEYYNNLGNVYFQKGDYGNALKNYSIAIELNPRYADALYNRATVFVNRGENGKALLDLNVAIGANPGDPAYYSARAGVYFHLGEYDRAWEDVRHLQKAGYPVEPAFLEGLRKASGKLRDN